jgi:hypothetical protein
MPPKLRHDEMIQQFFAKIDAARVKYGSYRVFNMDETSWKDVHLNGNTMSSIRLRMRLFVWDNTKVMITASCTLSINGDKYPPWYILRGKQRRLIETLAPFVDSDRMTLSKMGWMDEMWMLRYLLWVHAAMNQHPFALDLDSVSCTAADRRFESISGYPIYDMEGLFCLKL